MPLRLTRRPDSPYWWIAGTVAGRRIRESTGTADRAAADEFRAARELAIYRAAVHGAPVARASFAACVVSYLEHAGPHSAPTRARIKRILDELGPLTLADDVDQPRIDQLCAKLLRPGSAPATRLREIISPVRAILTHAARRKMCAFPAFDIGKASPSRTEWLSPAEADLLITHAAPHIKPLLAFLFGTGARLGEALALRWQDVDLPHARALLRDTKNGRDRPVDLCPRVVAALSGITKPKQAGGTKVRTGPVFCTQTGTAYLPRKKQGGGQIKTAWNRAMTAAGISKHATPHTCRHTWASWHYAMHRDVLLLRTEGGWASAVLVERYAHLVPSGMVNAIRKWRGEKARHITDTPIPSRRSKQI